MGIEIRPSDEAAAYAQAGQTIGKGERAKEERARAERQQEQAAQQQARQTAMEWEMQKMLLNSQQDFAHEMRLRQADLDAEARAKEWEVEKMELHSRFDFEQEEKERLRINATYDAAKNMLDEKKENMPDGEYERALFRLDSIYAPKGVTKAVEGLGHKEQTGELFNLGGEETPPPSLNKNGIPNPTADNPLGLNIENIPTSQLPQSILNLEQGNKFEVISPDGMSETIDASEWPVKKSQGYILSQISKLRDRKDRLAPLGGKFYGGIAQ